ncbi:MULTISPECIES: helix-turn-helix domain-containing protein [Burkholderia cepacia complex]|jgi:transcriptional regulator with XRE-family HTH domain|uniref:DNA-binding protein n=1 Tax=Burkholderia cenocepacia (strain ATCC BAA-245 / DSM 16553 / LMG 16656 / NCTC 13227 / J2315 / CF5610) TaxID=216591 RepID=B4EDL4_BURCJ|nr:MULTISPECIES: helix-turn-helix transcriptional regulator [Burkholderia cepacia complex]KIS47897.1 helix-turn-helix family protein [Burkholderia cepacia]EPZ84621.1 DNA-binding helix-turn-helix protein [Burkholderia cenocepacia K56-2Valvano]ERI30698.1 DNA-binding helix-turn-helix protein [Burkholderia cenocepacia BC7]KKI79623.1 XRE family transcriptional regulator [Burkholderia cenocepacia]MCG0578999.1 helix-turn-helix domain-containing protein [Burkholderia cenocepacia]
MPTLGEKIRTLRKRQGLTLDQLALQVSASKSSIWELENKEKARPSADRIDAIAQALGVTSAFLLDDTQAEPSRKVADEAFFRKYEQLDEPVKRQLQDILEVLDRKRD